MGSVDGLPPFLATLTVYYGTGTVDVSQVEVTDKVYIYAASTHAGVGPVLIATGVGPGIYNLDLSAFLVPLVENFQAPVQIAAVWTTDDINFSAPSNTVGTGQILLSTHLDRQEKVSLKELALRPYEGVIIEV